MPAPDQRIELSVPAQSRYLTVLRMAVRAAGAVAGLGVDRIDDAAQAVDEAAAGIFEGLAESDRIDMVLTVRPGGLEVLGEVVAPNLPVLSMHEMAMAVLGAVTDRHEVLADADRRGFTFVVGTDG